MENNLNQEFHPNKRTEPEELNRICEAEGISREELDAFLEALVESTEEKIEKHHKKINHLTVWNRQLRAAAAVFLLVASGALLMSISKDIDRVAGEDTYHAPFELAAGNKLLP